MRRKDCYFGLHFDFHANVWTHAIGESFDESVVGRICEEVKPDFIQCDTKGHPGYSSYPTKVGTPAPQIVRDILAGWRKATKKYGVLLFSHYSGLWEQKATHDHPEWAAVTADGAVTDKASVFGKYADELLIPQLKELAGVYRVDGAWVDGECWAQVIDYGTEASAAWRSAFGQEPPKEGEEGYAEFLAFQRKAFFAYVAHYISEVKKEYPDFDITSNWLNTAWVPDTLCVTDYISGDISPTNSVDSARFDGRIMQSFGRYWDIMSWGISFPVHCAKSAAQLCQEAAIVLSLGGGFQIYNMQSPQKTVMDEWAIPIWAEVARFCRERQEYCQGAQPVPDVGVLYSPKAYYDKEKELFCRDSAYNKEVCGMITALCDGGFSVSVLSAERAVRGEVGLSAYTSILVSDSTALEEGAAELLIAYAEGGGHLILCGKNTAELFAERLGLRLRHEGTPTIVLAEGADYAAELRCPYAVIERGWGECRSEMCECIVDGNLYIGNPPPSLYWKDEKLPAFVTKPYGKGKISVLPVSAGKQYFDLNSFEMKRWFRDCFGRDTGKLHCDKSGLADVLLTQKEGRKFIHAVNLLGEHRGARIKTFDYIPPVTDVDITFRTDRAPMKAVLRPDGREISFAYAGGELKIHLDTVGLHEIVELIGM